MSTGVALRLAVALSALAAALPAAADVTTTTPTTTDLGTTTTETVTTAPATTAETTPTTAPTTTTTVKTTTAAPRTTTGRRRVLSAVPVAGRAGCLLGGAALLLPHRRPLALGGLTPGDQSHVVYPANGSIVSAADVHVEGAGCAHRLRLRELSLFRGSVTVASMTVVAGARGVISDAIEGLRVGGRPASAGGRVRVGSWGVLDTARTLSIRLLAPHAGLPVGSALRLPFARPRHVRAKHRLHQPLKVTPPLGLEGYVFPVAGASGFVDTYGGLRTDVPGHWHHGDDIFAALGTPVVAVATGTVNRVGWEKIGGWRLWVRDRVGNEFYYAHLSGYAPAILHSNRVRAGEVIAFVGNTGDAFTTSPHVHFEIHPRPLLHLQYDGAVDPTRYLLSWKHVRPVDTPRPARPPLPTGAPGREARYVFRELLFARHLLRHRPAPAQRPAVRVPALHMAAPVAAAPAVPQRRLVSPLEVALLAGLGALGLAGVFSVAQAPQEARRRAAQALAYVDRAFVGRHRNGARRPDPGQRADVDVGRRRAAAGGDPDSDRDRLDEGGRGSRRIGAALVLERLRARLPARAAQGDGRDEHDGEHEGGDEPEQDPSAPRYA
jgi:murein DD-endopeptidase MepM/ murein hydrolase activator NlpD